MGKLSDILPKLLLTPLAALIVLHSAGQAGVYKYFDNIILSAEAPGVDDFIQDSVGSIWFCSAKGIYKYDGYRAVPHFGYGDPQNTRIYCGAIAPDGLMWLGGDNGLHIYDPCAEKYVQSPAEFPTDIRALLPVEGGMWIGSLSGLYSYDHACGAVTDIGGGHIPHQAVYAIASDDDFIYIGTYNGLCRYDITAEKFENIPLPQNRGRSNIFVNSLLADPARRCVWIGCEGSLFRYDVDSQSISTVKELEGNSLKSMAMDGARRLLVGTDNGLYVYSPESRSLLHSAHDSRDSRSLSNNIVWSVASDRDGNVWLGTDNAVSLAAESNGARLIPIAEITGSGDGNQFYTIRRDSKGYLWLGGDNGIIRVEADRHSGRWRSRWFRMGQNRYSIPHNRIRDIYQDRQGDLWVASDGSLNRYDYGRERFDQYLITATGGRNANWAYSIVEDSEGELWVSAFLGGIFGIDKKEIASSGRTYVAPHNYTTDNGLTSDAVNTIALDKDGNMWVLCYPDAVHCKPAGSDRFGKVDISTGGRELSVNYIFSDSEGNVWIGASGTLVRIDPASGDQTAVSIGSDGRSRILSMDDSENYLWIAASGSLYAVGKEDFSVMRLPIEEHNYTSIYYDSSEDLIYAGFTDGLMVFPPDVITRTHVQKPIYLMSLTVNNTPHTNLNKRSKLSHRDNNLTFTVADFDYAGGSGRRFSYTMEGLDDDWHTLGEESNSITYNNLSPGSYNLVVSAGEGPSEQRLEVGFKILQPWYWSAMARILYALAVIGLGFWLANSVSVRNKLRMERLLREQSLELSNMKMEFLTNISHELKTPLSMIVAPVNKVLSETRSERTRAQMLIAQKNAAKLNSMIHRVLEFNREEALPDAEVTLSRVDFVGFARSIYESHREAAKDRDLQFSFTFSHEAAFADIDLLKSESVINNMLSNACKYTPDGGNVSVTVEVREPEGEVALCVTDTGIGIPPEELPYVFGRFYESSSTAHMGKGTGVGLYIVKNYTELQGGRVEIGSEPGQGTSICAILSLAAEWKQNGSPAQINKAGENKPLVLIVEDNSEIREFLSQMLSGDYRVAVADNGRIGLEKAGELRPDIIISDIMMPVMDGLEMSRRLKRNTVTATIPIIILTAKDDKAIELESIEGNIDAFIAKPFDEAILTSRLRQLLSARQSVEQSLRVESITQPKPIAAMSPEEKMLARVTAIIEERIDDPELNVNTLSEISGIGQKQLYRKIKQLTGTTPVDYIRSIRLKKAAMLLSQKKFTVSEVMYMVGFSNQSYFSRAFQAEFGVTPRAYMISSEKP